MSEETREIVEQPTPEAELPPAEGEQSGEKPAEAPAEDAKAETNEEPKKEQTLDDLPLPGDEEDQEKDHEKNWPKGFKERLKRQDKQLAQREAEIAQLRQQLTSDTRQHVTQVADNQAPKRDDFANETDYVRAVVKYENEQERLTEQQKALHAQQVKYVEAVKKRQDEIDSKGLSKYDDYDEVTEVLFNPNFPPNRAMYEAITDSDFASDIMYFLGKYPEEAKKIAVLHPVKAIKAVAGLETRFKARKNTTQATRPVTTVKSQPASAVSGDPSKMSPTDYREWREAQKKR